MLKNYKELTVWQKAYQLCLHDNIGEVERMLKATHQILRKQAFRLPNWTQILCSHWLIRRMHIQKYQQSRLLNLIEP